MQRSVQEIFDLLIGMGLYTPHKLYNACLSREYIWMCYALDRAHKDGMITAEELRTTQAAILEYTSAGGEEEHTMCEALFALGKVDPAECHVFAAVRPWHCHEQLLAIYEDWENRPELPEGLYDAYDNPEY